MSLLSSNILTIIKDHHHYLTSFKNVRGIGLGHKFINGVATNELCIHVLVENKLNQKYLSCNTIPKTYMGLKTDVIEIGNPKASIGNLNNSNRHRPLKGGCSIYTKDATLGGTLGCIVVRKKTLGFNKYFILSNNHVLADSNKISIGTEIIQPSLLDGGKFEHDVVATLSEFAPINFPNGLITPKNFMDCAIAEVKQKSLISNEILKIGKIAGSSSAILGSSVKKMGITTDLTEGKIVTVNARLDVDFEGNKKALFTNQIIASLKSGPGDSGSVVLNEKNEVIGLLFGFGKLNTSMINDINLVLQKFNISIYK